MFVAPHLPSVNTGTMFVLIQSLGISLRPKNPLKANINSPEDSSARYFKILGCKRSELAGLRRPNINSSCLTSSSVTVGVESVSSSSYDTNTSPGFFPNRKQKYLLSSPAFSVFSLIIWPCSSINRPVSSNSFNSQDTWKSLYSSQPCCTQTYSLRFFCLSVFKGLELSPCSSQSTFLFLILYIYFL